MLAEPFLPQFASEWPSPDGDQLKGAIAAHFSWAVPTDQAIATICESSTGMVEIGAGCGYWAWLMRQAGLPVAAFDVAPPAFTWSRVDPGDERVAMYYPGHTLFLCWPPWNSDMAANALSLYRGNRVVYVGEWMGGSANTRFFAQLTSEFEGLKLVNIPQWHNRDDRLMVFRRRMPATP